MDKKLKIFILSLFAIVIIAGLILVSIFSATFININNCIKEQTKRLDALRAEYSSESYVSSDEQKFCDFDLGRALAQDIKLIDLQFLATHNSYKKEKSALEKFYANFSKELKDGNYYFETPTQQLNSGIRSFEFDIYFRQHQDGVSFHSFHIGYADMSSNVFDFALCLEEIDLWSQNNPNHLPITIILELKERGEAYPYKCMTKSQLADLDELIKSKITNLYTPANAIKDYDSLNEMRATENSPSLKETLGKVLFILHPGALTKDYVQADVTCKTQAMFPSSYFWWYKEVEANSFVIINNHALTENSVDKNGGRKNKYLFRIMLDDEALPDKNEIEKAIATGATICSTNRPPILPIRNGYESINFAPDGKTVRLVNDVTLN